MVGRQVFSLSFRVLISSLQTQEHRKLHHLGISDLMPDCRRCLLIRLFLIINLFLLIYQLVTNLQSLYFYFQRFRCVVNSLRLSVLPLVAGLEFSLTLQLKSLPPLPPWPVILNVGALPLIKARWPLNQLNAIVPQLGAIVLRLLIIILILLFYLCGVLSP